MKKSRDLLFRCKIVFVDLFGSFPTRDTDDSVNHNES